MAGSMQILVLEKAVYELEEMVKKVLKEINEKVELQDKKFEEYEKFLRNYEGGARLPAKVGEEKHVPGEKETEYGKNLQKEVAEKAKEKVDVKVKGKEGLKRRKR